MSVSDNSRVFRHIEEAYRGRRTVEAQFVRELIALASDTLDSKDRECESRSAGRIEGLNAHIETLSSSNDRLREDNASLRAQLQRSPLARSLEDAAEEGKVRLTVEPQAGDGNRYGQHHTWNVEELEELAYKLRAAGAHPKKDLVEFDRKGAHCLVPEEGTFRIQIDSAPPRMPPGDDPRAGREIKPLLGSSRMSPPLKITLIGAVGLAGVLQLGQWLVHLIP